VKNIKKPDEINGRSVIVKDFIKNSQVVLLNIKDDSPNKDIAEWLQTGGKSYGFIRPNERSWTPLVLAVRGGKLAVFCVEPPIIDEDGKGAYRRAVTGWTGQPGS